MRQKKSTIIANIFLIIYGILLFIRISLIDSVERDGFDIFQWILGPTLVIVLGYRVIKQLKNKENSKD